MRWIALVACLVACATDAPEPPPPAPSEPFPSERGLVDLDGRHVFYVLFSADADPANKPVFVLWNGGPGYPTTLGLLSGGTGPHVVDERGAVVPNPASFTSLGSLLYLDQPATGFSYDDAAIGSRPFDMVGDGVAFARAIVRVLDGHPDLRANDVVLVGESYGGARAQLVLSAVFGEAHPDVSGHAAAIAPRTLEEQFAAQVLIQPMVMGRLQLEASVVYGGSCPYDTRQTNGCRVGTSSRVLADPASADVLLGGPLEQVAGLAGPARHGAARSNTLGFVEDIETELVTRLGPLGPGDAYFREGPTSQAWIGDTLVPAAFVANLAHVDTLITNALHDGVIDSPAIGRALGTAGHATTFDTEAGVLRVQLPAGPTTIRMPAYEAGHAVAESAAAELRDDIARMLDARSRRTAR